MRAINTFWNWFQDNNQTIKKSINETIQNQEHILFWINKHLGYYCKEIDFMIVFPNTLKDKTEFIITSNGNPEYSNQVIALIDNAPKLKTWEFTAVLLSSETETSKSAPFTIIFPDITLKSSDSKFLSLDYNKTDKKENVIIHLKNQKILCNIKTLNQVVHILSKDPLSVMTVDKNITLIQLPQEPHENIDRIQLYDLEIHIDILNRQSNQ